MQVDFVSQAHVQRGVDTCEKARLDSRFHAVASPVQPSMRHISWAMNVHADGWSVACRRDADGAGRAWLARPPAYSVKNIQSNLDVLDRDQAPVLIVAVECCAR